MKSSKILFLILLTIVLSLSFDKNVYAGWSLNLIVNPDAESGDSNGWVHTDNFYATNSQDQSIETVSPYEGDYFFSMAKNSSTYEKAFQNVDVSDYSESIDTGNIRIKVGAWIQNEYLDSCKISIQYLDSEDLVIKEDSTEEITDSNGYWSEQTLIRIIPIGTESINFIIEGYLYTGEYVNIFFDNSYLYIEDASIDEVCTQAELDAQYEAGKQYCIENPEECGISVGVDCPTPPTQDCAATFDMITNTLHIPNFQDTYWLDFGLVSWETVQFELKDVGEIK